MSQQGLQDARRNATHCQVHGVAVAERVRSDRNRKCYAVTLCPCHCGVYPVQRCLSRCYVPHRLMFDPLFRSPVFPHTQCVSGIRTGTSLTAGSGGFLYRGSGCNGGCLVVGRPGLLSASFRRCLSVFRITTGCGYCRVGVSIKSAGFSARASFSRAPVFQSVSKYIRMFRSSM